MRTLNRKQKAIIDKWIADGDFKEEIMFRLDDIAEIGKNDFETIYQETERWIDDYEDRQERKLKKVV